MKDVVSVRLPYSLRAKPLFVKAYSSSDLSLMLYAIVLC